MYCSFTHEELLLIAEQAKKAAAQLFGNTETTKQSVERFHFLAQKAEAYAISASALCPKRRER